MKVFKTPKWEFNSSCEETFSKEFETKKVKSGRIEKVKNNKNMFGNRKTKKKIEGTNSEKNLSNIKSSKNLSNTDISVRDGTKNQNSNNLQKKISYKQHEVKVNKKITKRQKNLDIGKDKHKRPPKLNSNNTNAKNKQIVTNKSLSRNYIEDLATKRNSQKKSLTHQTLFFRKSKGNKQNIRKQSIDVRNVANKEKSSQIYKESWRKLSKLPLRERMEEKLKAARFRYLNEQMYTNTGKEAKQYFDSDINAYKAYHDGYRLQVSRWPINPIDIIINEIKKLPHKFVIADFGCGDAKLAKSVPHKVYSFDLVAVDETVTACDMAHVPLPNDSVDVVIFCLSLMGTNLKEYLMEAKRVLKEDGLLKIAEVESRFDSIERFITILRSCGFINKSKDLSHNMFCFLDFVLKKSTNLANQKFPNITLKPCLYKKR